VEVREAVYLTASITTRNTQNSNVNALVRIMSGLTGWVLSGLASYVGVSSSASSSAAGSGSGSGVLVGIPVGAVGILIGIVAVILIPLQAIMEVTLIPWPVLVLAVAASLCLIAMYKSTSTPDYQSGHSFVQMVCNTEYGRRYFCLWFRKLLDTPGRCDVYLITNGGTTGLHWTLLVKMRGSRINLPYLSIEIYTDGSMEKMISTMRQLKKLPTAAKFKGFITNRSIKELCKMADIVQSEMGSYNIKSRNCQNFCNKLLTRMNLPPETTTVQELTETAANSAVAATAVLVVTVATAGASPFIIPFLGIAAVCAALYNHLRRLIN